MSCCVEVGKVGRTFEFMMDIDFCNQKFTVGIEKLVEEVSLNMFEYGKSWVFLRFYFENESLYQNIENYIKVFWILWINLRTFLILYLLFQHSYYSVQFKEKKCMLIELKMQSFSLLGVRKEIVIMGVIKVWYVWQIKISITAQHSPYRNNFWTIWSSLLPTFLFPNRYTIWDNVGEGVYVVTVDLAICFEDGGNCLVNVNIFEKVKLSKQICVWAAQFLHPGKNINIFGILYQLNS